MFGPLPAKPDHNALELAILDLWAREGTFDQLRAQNADGPKFRFIDGPVTANKSLAVHTAWGRTLKDVFLRYKALQRLPPALPERLRLPGPVDRGRRREAARPELQAGDRGVRPRRVRRGVPRRRRAVGRRADGRVDPPRPVDGLGQRLLHVLRHEHRVHLEVPPDRPRAGLALQGPPGDGVVPALRHVDLGPRARRQLHRQGGPVALRPLPAARPARRGARHLDDDAVDAAGERRRGRQARPRLRPPRRTATGSPSAPARPRSSSRRSPAPSSSAGATRARSTR